jgi:hypothetical protein
MAIESFSLFLTPFHMLGFVSMVLLVCSKRQCHDNGSTVAGPVVTYPKFRASFRDFAGSYCGPVGNSHPSSFIFLLLQC